MLWILMTFSWYLVFFLKLHYCLEAQDYELIFTFIGKFQSWMYRKTGLMHILKQTIKKRMEQKCLGAFLLATNNCGVNLLSFIF